MSSSAAVQGRMTLARSSFAPAPNRAFRSRNVVKAPARRTRSGVAVKAEGDFDRLNVVIVGAECAPFSKTGGLGDVVQSLPKVRGLIHLVDILFPLPKRAPFLRRPNPHRPRAYLDPNFHRIRRRSCVVVTASCPSSPCTTTTTSATPPALARSST